MQVASLLQYASASLPTTPAADGSSPATSSAAVAMGAAATQLLGLLATSGNVQDAQQMNNMLAAGAQLSAGGHLSTDAGMSLISMFRCSHKPVVDAFGHGCLPAHPCACMPPCPGVHAHTLCFCCFPLQKCCYCQPGQQPVHDPWPS